MHVQDAPPQHDAPPDVESDSWLRWVSWRHIRVGDIVCLRDGDEIPVDLVLLTSTMQNGSAMIETSNLDGYVLSIFHV
jgi:P-type E1-E2 ATPase